MNQSLLTAADVARLPGVELTPAGVKAAAARGELAVAARTPFGTRLFRLEDASAFATSRKASAGRLSARTVRGQRGSQRD